MAWHTSDRVMKIRRQYHFVDVAVETLDGWRLHLSGRNASLLAFFAFLSIFPLMLAATTIFGWVLADNTELQEQLINGAADEIPIIGETLKENPRSLSGDPFSLIIGLAGALWSSSKAFVGLQSALDDTWDLHVDDRAGLPIQRGKAFVGILILGSAQVGSIVLATVVSAAGLPGFGQIAIFFGTVLINILVMAAMYRYLTSAYTTWRMVWPGAILAGAVMSILQRFGPDIVKSIAAGVEPAYETFYVVIGLVTWLGFVAIAILMSAELNAAINRLKDRDDDFAEFGNMGADFDLPVRV